MTTYSRQPVRRLSVLITIGALSGCQPALIYGERTSFNLGAIHVNDNVAEPLKINIGFSRSVATMAPPRGGLDEQTVKVADSAGTLRDVKTGRGDAVSVFSNFSLHYGDRQDGTASPLPLVTEDLNIHTRFASGEAAIAMSSDKAAVSALLAPRTVVADKPDVAQQKKKLIGCVKGMQDGPAVERLAKTLGVSISAGNVGATRSSIITAIANAGPAELAKAKSAAELQSCK